MGYHFNSSKNQEKIDIIITTKAGIEFGGLPKGVIIPDKYKHMPEVSDYIRDTKCNVFSVHYYEKRNEMAEIVSISSLSSRNRFGWFLTRDGMETAGTNWTLDIGCGKWLKRMSVDDIKEIEKYL